MKSCPCGTGKNFSDCCGPFLEGHASAPTAEALMRSRYTAFALNRLDYIERTCASEMRETFDRAGAESGSGAVSWLGLEILRSSHGGETDEIGTVEFAARYLTSGIVGVHRENSVFRRENGDWVYVAGDVSPGAPLSSGTKVGRNDPCPCGSGRKFKKCCGA